MLCAFFCRAVAVAAAATATRAVEKAKVKAHNLSGKITKWKKK